MKIFVMFGTESGNAEMVADDVSDSLARSGHDVEVADLQDVEPMSVDTEALHLIVCSTHGEGDLPESAKPFYERVRREHPDLVGLRYAMFGLGDHTYEHYSRGSEIIDEMLAEFGAQRIGRYGRHDASSRDLPSDLAVAWADEVLASVLQVA